MTDALRIPVRQPTTDEAAAVLRKLLDLATDPILRDEDPDAWGLAIMHLSKFLARHQSICFHRRTLNQIGKRRAGYLTTINHLLGGSAGELLRSLP